MKVSFQPSSKTAKDFYINNKNKTKIKNVHLRWTKSSFLCRLCPLIWNKELQLRKTQRIRSIEVKSSDQRPLNDKMFCMESRLQRQHHVFNFTSRCSFIIRFYTVHHHPLRGNTFFLYMFYFCYFKGGGDKKKKSLLWSPHRSFTAPRE